MTNFGLKIAESTPFDGPHRFALLTQYQGQFRSRILAFFVALLGPLLPGSRGAGGLLGAFARFRARGAPVSRKRPCDFVV